jgi:predicted GH43/DUF377 family glycosyl hydrolase
VKQTGVGKIYRIGAAILDIEKPYIIRGHTSHFIFGPEELYERIGDVPNVVFPCGVILEEDGTIRMYYGVADTAIALATAKVDDVVKLCLCQ